MAIATTAFPPPRRTREKMIDEEFLASAADLLQNGEYASNGRSYKTVSSARVSSFITRKAVAEYLGVSQKEIKGRVWAENGGFMFAIALKG